MPSTLRRFSKPLVTPSTMLAIRLRVRPCRARFWRSSSGRVTRMTLAAVSYSTLMLRCGRTLSLPSGPSTRTSPSSRATLTLAGTGTGCLPIRDIFRPLTLPNRAEELAAQPLGAGLAVAHDALARAQDADAQAVQHRAQLGGAAVQAAARLGGP